MSAKRRRHRPRPEPWLSGDRAKAHGPRKQLKRSRMRSWRRGLERGGAA